MPIITFSLPAEQYESLTRSAQAGESPNLCAKRFLLATLGEGDRVPGAASSEHLKFLDERLEALESGWENLNQIVEQLVSLRPLPASWGDRILERLEQLENKHLSSLDDNISSNNHINNLDEIEQTPPIEPTNKQLTLEDAITELETIKASLAASGVRKTNKEIAAHLNLARFPSPIEGKPWTAGAIGKWMSGKLNC